MFIRARGMGSAAVVVLEGPWTAGTNATLLHRLVGQLARSPGSVIVIDFGKVERIDCAGIADLVRLHNSVGATGGELRLANVGRLQREMLETLHLVGPLAVFDTLRQALRGCRSARGARPRALRRPASCAGRGPLVYKAVEAAARMGGM